MQVHIPLKRYSLHFLFFAIFSALLLPACKVSAPTTQDLLAQNIDFIVLQMNDVYEIAPLEGGKAGGLARVGTVRKELLKENPNTITVLSGDFLSPSFIGTLKTDEGEKIAGLQMVETLNALGLDYVTFGNHEFDISDPDLLEKRMSQSDFLYICSNVVRKTADGMRPFQQVRNGETQPVPEYIIKEFVGKKDAVLRVGITGVVLPFISRTTSNIHQLLVPFGKPTRSLNRKPIWCWR